MLSKILMVKGIKAQIPSAWNAAGATALLAALILLTGCGRGNGQAAQPSQAGTVPAATEQAPSNGPEQAVPKQLEVEKGTLLSVRLLGSISSSSAQAGERIDAELAAPVVVDGQTLFEKSARARVRVLSAEASGRLQNPGYLRVTLDSIQEPDGNWVSMNATSVSLEGKSHKKRNAVLIGGASAVGAAIGAIAGGGKGAAIGAVSGAGAGTAGAYATGKKDVAFPAESVLRFRTTSAITLGL